MLFCNVCAFVTHSIKKLLTYLLLWTARLWLEWRLHRPQKQAHGVIPLNIWTAGNLMEPDLHIKVAERRARSHTHAQRPWQHGRCEAAPDVLTFLGTFLWLLYTVCGLIQVIHSRDSLALLQVVNHQNSFSIPKYRRHNHVVFVVCRNLTTGGKVGCFHCIPCRFISGSKW